jgi:hypothetical protein
MNKMKRCAKQQGQTILEFVILFIVLVAAFLAMQKYIQRGVQGKWKESIDGMGKQYDPSGNMTVDSTMFSNAETVVNVQQEDGGYRTWRTDSMNMTENKIEEIHINGL